MVQHGVELGLRNAGPAQGHWYCDHETGTAAPSTSAYERPQPHACFIQSAMMTSSMRVGSWTFGYVKRVSSNTVLEQAQISVHYAVRMPPLAAANLVADGSSALETVLQVPSRAVVPHAEQPNGRWTSIIQTSRNTSLEGQRRTESGCSRLRFKGYEIPSARILEATQVAVEGNGWDEG